MLNKTMNKFNTTATTSHKQALQQELRIDQLETRLDNLTTTVQNLADRFDTFAEQMSDRQMTFTTVNLLFLLFCAIIMVRVSHSKSVHPDVQFLLDTMPRRPPLVTPFQRRNSETALHTVTQQGLRKGGSVTNIASASTPGFFIFDKRDAGPKKKKRKKHKASKPLDTESVCGTDSDPGCKLSSRGSGSSSHSPKFGHRRCDSATASFPSSTETVPEGREVMFSMGGKTIHASSDKDRNNAYHSIDPDQSLSLPYMIKDQGRGGCGCPTSVGYYRSDIPHLSSRSQRSKSVSSPSSPVGLETNWFDSGVAWGESVHGVQRVGSVHRGSGLANGRRSQDDIDKVSTSSREDGREGSSTPTGFARSVASPHVPNNPTHHHHPQPPPPNQRRSSLSAKSPSWFSFWPKTKKLASAPSSVLNGERESRGRVPDPPQQKGSLGARTEDCMESGVGSSKEAGRGRGNKRSLKSNLF